MYRPSELPLFYMYSIVKIGSTNNYLIFPFLRAFYDCLKCYFHNIEFHKEQFLLGFKEESLTLNLLILIYSSKKETHSEILGQYRNKQISSKEMFN